MKPDTRTAMFRLIRQIRETLPFDAPESTVCQANCQGCSVKLLGYLETELDAWEARLTGGDTPNFGDLEQLARAGRKIYRILQNNGVLERTRTPRPHRRRSADAGPA